jgi:signal transduction histidine kinase/ActR/RegA family two-component response regulator
MFKGMLDRALHRYEKADPVIRMKAKFLLLLHLLVMAIIPVAIAYSAWSHLRNPELGFRLNLVVLIPEALALLPLAAFLILLLRGRFSLSAHLLLSTVLLFTWIVIFVDRSGELSRLDTIAFVLGLLTLTPLVVVRRKRAILAYGAVNLLLLALFLLYAQRQLQLPLHRYMEYFADNTVAIFFITLACFASFLISQRALEQMQRELAERQRQENEAKRLQSQLIHAQKMESVGQLAGGVAHDFNNLLTTVIGNTSMALARLEPGSPVAARLRDVLRSAEGAASLTRQLLAFSQRLEIEPRPLNLNRQVLRIAGLLESLLGEEIKPELKLGAAVGMIVADPAQVEQIVINLAVNARDAMPDGGTLTIETRRLRLDASPAGASPILKPGDYVALVVADTGVGIPQKDLPRIFDPFFTTKPVGQGTGLGLASVYGAVRQNNGSIEVNSSPGAGTVMTVYFPAAGPAALPAEPAPRDEDLPRGDESLLLVEDDAMVLEFIQLVLSSLGYRVLGAGDGAAALARLASAGARFDLLLTDVILPDMTGMTLADRLRQALPEIAVIYMSGHAEDVVAHDRVENGSARFIAKPFTAQELARLVRQVLDNRDA